MNEWMKLLKLFLAEGSGCIVQQALQVQVKTKTWPASASAFFCSVLFEFSIFSEIFRSS